MYISIYTLSYIHIYIYIYTLLCIHIAVVAGCLSRALGTLEHLRPLGWLAKQVEEEEEEQEDMFPLDGSGRGGVLPDRLAHGRDYY